MTENDVELYNCIHLYEQLLQEITYKIRPILSELDSAEEKNWLQSLIVALQQKSARLLELASKNSITISDFKTYTEYSEKEEEEIFAIQQMVPNSCLPFVSAELAEELLKLRGYLKKINQKLFVAFAEAMMFCLDRDLRKLSIDLGDYHDESAAGVSFNFQKLLEHLATRASEPQVNRTREELEYCLANIDYVAVYNGCNMAILTFRDAVRIATELDLCCKQHNVRRLEYVYQGLDIAAKILSGFCSADTTIWTKEPPISRRVRNPEFKLGKFTDYADVHQLDSVVERVSIQYAEEKRIFQGGNPVLEVESRPYKFAKFEDAKSQQEEAKKIATQAIDFALESRANTNAIACNLSQPGLGNGHAVGLKFVRVNSIQYGQFRDANAGSFEFGSREQFINWFADFYRIMNYQSMFTSYKFAYPAPAVYAEARDTLLQQQDGSGFHLAFHCRQSVNEPDQNTGTQAQQLYRKIRHPTEFSKQQLIFCFLASSSSLIEKDRVLSRIYAEQAETIMRAAAVPTTRMVTLLYANIYGQLAFIHLLDGNSAVSLEKYLRLRGIILQSPLPFPQLFVSQVTKVIDKLRAPAALADVKEDAEKLDNQLTILNTALQAWFARKLYAFTEPTIRAATLRPQVMEGVVNYSCKLQRQALPLLYAWQWQQTWQTLAVRMHSVTDKKATQCSRINTSLQLR